MREIRIWKPKSMSESLCFAPHSQHCGSGWCRMKDDIIRSHLKCRPSPFCFEPKDLTGPSAGISMWLLKHELHDTGFVGGKMWLQDDTFPVHCRAMTHLWWQLVLTHPQTSSGCLRNQRSRIMTRWCVLIKTCAAVAQVGSRLSSLRRLTGFVSGASEESSWAHFLNTTIEFTFVCVCVCVCVCFQLFL